MAEMDKKLSHELHLIKRQHSKLMVCAPHYSSTLVILGSLQTGTKIIPPCQPLAICCLKPPTRVNNFKQLNYILMSSDRRFGDLAVCHPYLTVLGCLTSSHFTLLLGGVNSDYNPFCMFLIPCSLKHYSIFLLMIQSDMTRKLMHMSRLDDNNLADIINMSKINIFSVNPVIPFLIWISPIFCLSKLQFLIAELHVVSVRMKKCTLQFNLHVIHFQCKKYK